jgi:prefoldin subunit 5
MIWRFVLDGVVIALLGVGIFYAWKLERLLRGLDRNREEMQKFVASFSSSITRAEKGIRELQDTAQDSGVEVDRQIAKAKTLRDELSYLVDAADKIASRLTDMSTQAISARAPAALAPEPKVEEVLKAAAPPPATKPEPAPVVAPEPVAAKEEAAPGPPPVPPWARRATQQDQVIASPSRRPEKTQMTTAQVLRQMNEGDILRKTAERSMLRSQAERDLQSALEKIR